MKTEPPRRYSHLAPKAPEGNFRLDLMVPGTGPLELDVGFGRGASLLSRAAAAPSARLVGIEVKTKWAYRVEQRRKRLGLERVRVLAGDAGTVLARAEPDACISRAFVHFPDPWWKKRHAKRQLIDRAFLDELARLLVTGGELFIQTDVEDRARQYLALLRDHPGFSIPQSEGFIDENPFGAVSNRERCATEDGLPIWRILAVRGERSATRG